MGWKQTIANLARSTREWFGRRWVLNRITTNAGVNVDHESALGYSAVYACIRVIAESLAMLPLHVYQREGSRRNAMPEHVADWLLSTQANPEMTAMEARAFLYASALSWGNGYAEIERDLAGRPLWLWPLHSERVRACRNEAGELVYRVRNNDGTEAEIPAADMLHLHGLGFDGITGYSTVTLARESIGAGLAMDQFASSFFGNGLHAGSVLKHPGKLSDQSFAHLKESLKEFKQGARNAFKPFILEEGMDFARIGIPPEDAQFLESRTFQIVDICRWFRVPPHKLGVLDKATFSNIEHQALEFVTETLLPWATRFEQECNVKLFGLKQRGRLYVKHNFGAMLRGDLRSRYAAYAIGRQWSWLSANDIRELEELNPVPGGDVYLAPLNMVPADMLRELAEQKVKPEPPPQPEAQPGDDPAGDANREADEQDDPAGAARDRGANARVIEMAQRIRKLTH